MTFSAFCFYAEIFRFNALILEFIFAVFPLSSLSELVHTRCCI